jgi:hypothetical protein
MSRAFPIIANSEIPWEYAEEIHREYAHEFSNGQSLERIAARGGFGTEEAIRLLVRRIRRLENRPP